MKKIRKAVIPAGGWGTRCLPASKAIPKEMLPIVDKPAIQYAVEEAVAAGITDILIITGRNKGCIEDHFDRNIELEYFLEVKGKRDILEKVIHPSDLVNIYYTRQKEQKGLGHAVSCAREFVGQEPFAVILPDDLIRAQVPCLKQMVDIYQKNHGTVISVMEVGRDEVSKYGIIKPVKLAANLLLVEDMVEKPPVNKAPSRYAVVGRYIIEPEIFDCLERIEPGAGGEIQLTDALKMMAAQSEVFGYKFYGTRYDVGNVLGFIQANIEMGLCHPEHSVDIERIIGDLNNSLLLVND